MEAKSVATVAVAPVLWGSLYVVTHRWLPPDSPLWGSVLRALPAGLVLLLLARARPHGAWWWRSAVLGTLNVGAFFALVYVASHLLPSSVAASVMALGPLALAASAWLVLRERPSVRVGAGMLTGVAGVLLLLGGARGGVTWLGVGASVGALVIFSLGGALARRWRDEVPLLASTSWQLLAGGLLLVPAAVVVEGDPPALDGVRLAVFAYVALIATALAFVCWFAGLARLPAAVVGTVGLLNPLTGVALGTLTAGERLTPWQATGLGLAVVGVLVAVRDRPPGRRTTAPDGPVPAHDAARG